jgi:hypothetical protein
MKRKYLIAVAAVAIVASAVASIAILGTSEQSKGSTVGTTGTESQQQNGLTAQGPAQSAGNVKDSDGDFDGDTESGESGWFDWD